MADELEQKPDREQTLDPKQTMGPKQASDPKRASGSEPAPDPKVEKRRVREKRVISQMIALYCRKNHDRADRTVRAHCGEMICPECAVLDDYAVLRTENCRNMATKISCEECGNHCYKPEMREQIRAIMRFSGPRMITNHPIEAVRHMMGK